MSRVDENATRFQFVNEEAKILLERHRLYKAQRLDEGLPHELYCTLCGIPFWFLWNLHGYFSAGDENFYAWVSYFLARE